MRSSPSCCVRVGEDVQVRVAARAHARDADSRTLPGSDRLPWSLWRLPKVDSLSNSFRCHTESRTASRANEIRATRNRSRQFRILSALNEQTISSRFERAMGHSRGNCALRPRGRPRERSSASRAGARSASECENGRRPIAEVILRRFPRPSSAADRCDRSLGTAGRSCGPDGDWGERNPSVDAAGRRPFRT
jgi:hypothetical protein